tara:strand:+ start:304 stop:1254 length:951 start_codon:yes stop_codon:yes gene_type:complete
MRILVTGCCGFIGFHTTAKLLKKNYKIIGIDNLNNYYDKKIKVSRLKILKKNKNFLFYKKDLNSNLQKIFKKKIDSVINFSAQPGVRSSFLSPEKYLKNNITAYFNLLENCKKYNIKKIITASSSSVYGNSKYLPSRETNKLKPENFYALTKCSNEQMSEFYSRVFNLNITSLRYFTVFGPYGRPDMLIWKLCRNLFFKDKIYIHNFGKHKRDFTYIDDAVNMTLKVFRDKSLKNFNIFNICNSKPINLKNILKIFNKYKNLNNIKYISIQRGEVKDTYGSSSKFEKYFKKVKRTHIKKSISLTIEWFKNYHKIKK